MAVKTLRVSDVSGKVIDDDTQVVTVIVLDHPLIDNPVQLDVSSSEADGFDIEKDDYVILELVTDGGDKRERVVMQAKKFDAMFSDEVDEVLSNADKYELAPSRRAPEPEPRRRQSAARSTATKTDYTAPENYGLRHRGRTTEAEAELVRNNLSQANANRRREGQPEINLNDPKDVKRYGLQEVAEKSGVTLTPEFKA